MTLRRLGKGRRVTVAASGVEGAQREKGNPAPGLLHLLHRFGSENSRHAMAVTLDLFESAGKGL